MKGEQKKKDELMSGSLTLDRRVAQQEVSETKPKGKKEELRRSNGRSKSTFNSSPDVIDVIGNAPWGTHLCQFYRTKEDLFDILVPYFKAGLENNEFCMWVTSEPVDEKEAREVMRGAVPGFDQYLKTGQIEMVPYREWYLKGGAFNLKRILNAWLDKLEGALAEGYDGMRVTGNAAWLEKRDWRKLADYEEEISNLIGNYRMIAMCTYSLDRCGPLERIDVVQNHQLALIRREGKWELTENSERKKVEKQLRGQKEFTDAVIDALTDTFYIFDPKSGKATKRVLEKGHSTVELTYITKDGRRIPFEYSSVLIRDPDGRPCVCSVGRDITDRRKGEGKVQSTLGKLRRTLRATIQAMVLTVEMRDAYTAGHQRRVTNLASAIAKEMHLSGDEVDGIRMAGSIHDIGKIGVPAEILNKPVRLAHMEFELIKTHPAIGYNILKEIQFPWPVAKIVLQHHERIDGSGYPHGLSGDAILLEARILAVADVVEALASHRPYRPALGINKALEEIREKRGTLYDQEVVDACLKLFTEKGFKFE